jgi:hypothetical protein
VGAWYTIGLFAGLGVAVGVLLAGLLAGWSFGGVASALLGAAVGLGLALAFADWPEAVAAAVGAVLGGLGATVVVRRSLERGGERAGTAVLVGGAALLLGGLAFVPLLGYLEAAAVPLIAARLRRRGGRTYAGLRILARDE